jgi:hypothetical protein
MKFISELKITHASYMPSGYGAGCVAGVCVLLMYVGDTDTRTCIYTVCIVYNDLQSHPIYKELLARFFCLLNVYLLRLELLHVMLRASCWCFRRGGAFQPVGRCATPPSSLAPASSSLPQLNGGRHLMYQNWYTSYGPQAG